MFIKLHTGFLLVVAAYLGWWSLATASFVWLLTSVVLLVVAVGLFLSKRWAQYLWYVMALVASLTWLITIVSLALSGWPQEDALTTIISLVPGLFLVTVCAVGSAIVAKHYRSAKNAR